MKVLLVEGTRSQAALIQAALAASDIDTVTLAFDAQSALNALAGESFDGIVIDHALPDMAVLDFVQVLRARGVDAALVVLTGHGDAGLASACVSGGANASLQKEEGFLKLLAGAVRHAFAEVRAERRARELEQQLRRKSDELEVANRRLADYQSRIVHAQKGGAVVTLVRGVCHELNNPLTGILGYAQLLQEVWEGEGLDDLREIETCAQRCREIISKLARFCRQDKPTLAMISVNEAISESLSFVEYFANRHRVTMASELQADLPLTLGIVGDLRQAFLAVFVNAVQSMIPRKGGTLKVKSYASDGLIYVTVSDTGVGIGPEIVDRIFQPFFSTREAGDGNGMGLAIAYGIVREHEGTVLVDSVVEQGSTFSFVMPIRTHIPTPEALEATPV